MRIPLVVALALSAHASASAAQTPPPCGPEAVAVYAPGCDGPPVLQCSTGVSLPALSEWCACDGRTVSSPSMAPPQGLRYRFEGACGVTAHFDVTAERSAAARPTGRDVVFMSVAGVLVEAARVQGPCRDAPAAAGELGRVVCGARGVTLTLRREGDAVVAREGSRAVQRLPMRAGQQVAGAPMRRN